MTSRVTAVYGQPVMVRGRNADTLFNPLTASALATAAVSLILYGCGSDRGTEVTSSGNLDRGGAVPAEIVADPAGGGWLIERPTATDEAASVHRVDEDGAVSSGSALPPWDSIAGFGTSDGQLLLAGVRCERLDPCDQTIAEFTLGSTESRDQFARFPLHEGAPYDSDGVRIIGEQEGSFWIAGVGTEIILLNRQGTVAAEAPAVGDPCLLDGRLFTLTEPSTDHESDEPRSVTPGSDAGRVLTVMAYEGGKFTPVANGETEANVSTIARCTSEGFEVSSSVEQSMLKWDTTTGWHAVERGDEPKQSASSHALGSRLDEYVVDESGQLLRRMDGAWRPTTIIFEATRTLESPPLALFVDSAASSVLACVGSEQGSLECASGRYP